MSLRTAVEHLERGEWQEAHTLVQDEDSPLASWAHAIVHLQEGDVENARYWFGRAGRTFSTDVRAETEALMAAANRAR